MENPKRIDLGLKQVEHGIVEWDKWPEGSQYLVVVVYNKSGQWTMWNAPVYKTQKWRVNLRGALSRGYHQVELWTDYWGEERSNVVALGEQNINQAWEETAIIYRGIINEHRQKAAVHKKMAQDAVNHHRPAGQQAHAQARGKHLEVMRFYQEALKHEEEFDQQTFENLEKEAEQITTWANRQDSVNPPAPAALVYNFMGFKFLKAQEQFGYDRRPHTLCKGVSGYELYYWGEKLVDDATFCLEKDWNEVARGERPWMPLRLLKKEDVVFSNKCIFIKVDDDELGEEITRFDFPE